MNLQNSSFHLTYCTNIHAADGWEGVYANLKQYAPALKARFSPSAPFGVGLRLSAREASELLEGDRLREFRAFLDREGLYVALINGFPYGPFHGTPVKANVYAPDWRDEARVDYTIDLIRILQALLPDGLDGGVSTAPLSYKAWVADAGPETWETMTRNVVRVAVALVRIRREHGTLIHLDIEPEPDCVLENTEESVVFFEQWLFSVGALMLAASLGINPDEARRHLQDHIRLCFDCCHFAVEYEDPAAALERLRTAGIQIGRVQLSSALHVHFPSDAQEAADVAGRLRPFADTTYLHQVVEQQDTGLRHYPDLDVALGDKGSSAAEWRIHFHVPLFASEYDAFGSTQDYVRKVLGLALQTPFTTHLEIETYTWDVLPPGLKMDLGESIAREYDWVLQTIAALTTRPQNDANGRPQRGRPDPGHGQIRSSEPCALGRGRGPRADSTGVPGRHLHRAVRLPHRPLPHHPRHRRQRVVRARGCRDPVLETIEQARAGPEDLGARARTRSHVHVRQRVLVVQHVFDRGLHRHAAADVSGRRPEAARRLHRAGRSARRAASEARDVPPLQLLGAEGLDRVQPLDRRIGEARRAEILADALARLPAAPRLQPAARRSERSCCGVPTSARSTISAAISSRSTRQGACRS